MFAIGEERCALSAPRSRRSLLISNVASSSRPLMPGKFVVTTNSLLPRQRELFDERGSEAQYAREMLGDEFLQEQQALLHRRFFEARAKCAIDLRRSRLLRVLHQLRQPARARELRIELDPLAHVDRHHADVHFTAGE